MSTCFPETFVSQRSTDNPSLSVEERADRHVRRLQGFYIHLAAYVGVNALLVGINLLTSPGVFWAVWPILGWGIKLGAHAVAVFGGPGVAEWKDRVRRDYIRRHTDRPATELRKTADDLSGDSDELRQRIEHLEAIVTSADWDLLADLDASSDPEQRAAALADETVSA